MGERRQHPKGFTLIELLVVIAIIALLVTMLLPSLKMARDLARFAACKNNIRGVAIANQLYAETYGRYVLAAEDMWDANMKRWHGQRDPAKGEMAFVASRGPLIEFLGSDGIKECPSFVRKIDDPAMGAFEAGCGGYGYNQIGIGSALLSDEYDSSSDPNREAAGIEDVERPSQTVMFTDAAQLRIDTGGLIAYSFVEPPENPASSRRPCASIHFRHMDNRCSVAWADTHVSEEKLAFSDAYTTYGAPAEDVVRQYELGWFGPDSIELFDRE